MFGEKKMVADPALIKDNDLHPEVHCSNIQQHNTKSFSASKLDYLLFYVVAGFATESSSLFILQYVLLTVHPGIIKRLKD